MIGDAIASVACPATPRTGGATHMISTDALAELLQTQSKTLVSLLDAKVDSAEARVRDLEAQHQPYQKSVSTSRWHAVDHLVYTLKASSLHLCVREQTEEQLAALRLKSSEAEAATVTLREEMQKYRDELTRQAAATDCHSTETQTDPLTPETDERTVDAECDYGRAQDENSDRQGEESGGSSGNSRYEPLPTALSVTALLAEGSYFDSVLTL